MDMFILVIALACLTAYLMKGAMETVTYVAKPCKPHVWRYKDSAGWLDRDIEDDERIRHATLWCTQCGRPPSQDSGSKNGEYE